MCCVIDLPTIPGVDTSRLRVRSYNILFVDTSQRYSTMSPFSVSPTQHFCDPQNPPHESARSNFPILPGHDDYSCWTSANVDFPASPPRQSPTFSPPSQSPIRETVPRFTRRTLGPVNYTTACRLATWPVAAPKTNCAGAKASYNSPLILPRGISPDFRVGYTKAVGSHWNLKTRRTTIRNKNPFK